MAKTIEGYGEDYRKAKAAGDAAGMLAANRGANGIRTANGQLPEYATEDINNVRSLSQNTPGYVGSATTVDTSSASQQNVIDRMNENSRRWNETTDQDERDRLHSENQSLSEQLGGNITFNPTTGTWSGTAERDDFSYKNASKYTDKYSSQIQSILGGLLNRDKFSYDAESDPLYQQYKQQYTAAGQKAMEDTMGQVSARTGGLASSYAGTASQQAYDSYMAQLASKVPELYQLAYSMYQDEINNDRSNLSLLQTVSDSDYSRFNTDRTFDYNAWQGNESQRQWQEEMARNLYNDNRDEYWKRYSADYQQERDYVSDQQWDKTYDMGQYWNQKNYDLSARGMQLDESKFDYSRGQDALDNALTRAEMLGYVATEEDAKLLGVPVGTTTLNKKIADAQIYNYMT